MLIESGETRRSDAEKRKEGLKIPGAVARARDYKHTMRVMANHSENKRRAAMAIFFSSGRRILFFAADSTAWTLSSGDARIDVQLSDDVPGLKATLTDWIQTAAKAVSTYYGRYPVPHLDLHIRVRSGHGVNHGVTHAGRRIDIAVGKRNVTPEEFPQRLDADARDAASGAARHGRRDVDGRRIVGLRRA